MHPDRKPAVLSDVRHDLVRRSLVEPARDTDAGNVHAVCTAKFQPGNHDKRGVARCPALLNKLFVLRGRQSTGMLSERHEAEAVLPKHTTEVSERNFAIV